MKSYRDLPKRYGETSTLFRNENSGEMHGLIRVRQFTISEGHLMCTPAQLEQEFKGCLELARYCLKCVGLDKTYPIVSRAGTPEIPTTNISTIPNNGRTPKAK